MNFEQIQQFSTRVKTYNIDLLKKLTDQERGVAVTDDNRLSIMKIRKMDSLNDSLILIAAQIARLTDALEREPKK